MLTENDITLGMIIEYCNENNIVLNQSDNLVTINGNQQYGDLTAQTYFFFFSANKEKIVNWANTRYNNYEEEQTNSYHR